MSVRLIGVSTALRADEWTGLNATDQQAFTMEAFTKLEADLRRYTGDLRPVGMPAFTADGPHDDALQGPIYIWSCAAPYEVLDLPADCPAYVTWNTQ